MIYIVQDTREQAGKHENLILGFEKLGLGLVRSKNVVGDYIIPSLGKASVDIKQDMCEVCGNVTIQHDRFKRECQLAKTLGIKLYILVEEQTSYKELMSGRYIFKADKHNHLHTKANPIVIAKIMKTMEEKYGVKFLFTSKYESAIKTSLLLGIKYPDLIKNCVDEKYKERVIEMYERKTGIKYVISSKSKR